MTLDLNTLHFASAASRCAYVAVFLVMALSQPRQTYVWQWMGAMGASMAGSLIMMKVPPDTLPPIPVTMVTHWLYAASLVLSWTGLRCFFNRRVNVVLAVALVAMTGLIYPLALSVGLSPRIALAAVFVCCLAVTLLTTYESVRPTPGEVRLWSQYIETVAFGFYSLIFILSIGILLGTDRPIASAESARVSMILDQITGVFVYLGYVVMAAERANRALATLAETDPLTGLSNRRGLQAMLRRRVPRQGKRSVGGVLIADIDHFKSINDRYGHESGDLVLTAFATRMKAALRDSDIVARWGGEEFLVVLPGATPPELAAVAERLRASVEERPFLLPAGPLAVTVSIGAAEVEPNAFDFEAITRRADTALYAAKAGGRNRVCHAPAAAPTQRAQVRPDDMSGARPHPA